MSIPYKCPQCLLYNELSGIKNNTLPPGVYQGGITGHYALAKYRRYRQYPGLSFRMRDRIPLDLYLTVNPEHCFKLKPCFTHNFNCVKIEIDPIIEHIVLLKPICGIIMFDGNITEVGCLTATSLKRNHYSWENYISMFRHNLTQVDIPKCRLHQEIA